MLPAVGKVTPATWNAMIHDALEALRNERDRAVRIIDEHQAMGCLPG